MKTVARLIEENIDSTNNRSTTVLSVQKWIKLVTEGLTLSPTHMSELLLSLYRTGSRIHRIERWCRSWVAGVAHLNNNISSRSALIYNRICCPNKPTITNKSVTVLI